MQQHAWSSSPWAAARSIGREQHEATTLKWEHGAKDSLIEGQDAVAAVSLGQHHERGIGQAKPKPAVALYYLPRPPQFFPREALDHKGAPGQISQEVQLDLETPRGAQE